MSNTTPTTLRGWIEQAKQDGYVWAEKWLLLPDYELDLLCPSKNDCESYIMESLDEDCQFGWRHYHPDRIPKTDVYWVIMMQGGEPEKAVLHEGGYAYNPVTGIGFDQSAILFFHEINAPAGPEI